MIKNFITVATRNFLRQRLYSFINILGLTSGLICTLFIFLWVRDEVQKDKFHAHAEKIFHIVSNLDRGDGGIVTWGTPGPLGDDIREHIPEVELTARTQSTGQLLFRYESKTFLSAGYYADPEFFNIFSFKFTHGMASRKPLDKSWVCISQSLASKLFGKSDPIGKQIKISQKYDVFVTGVFENVPAASSLKFDFVLPYQIQREIRGDGFTWTNYDHPTYVRLYDENHAVAAIEKINSRAAKLQELKGVHFYMQLFSDNYLNGYFENGIPAGGRILYVKIFSVVAVFILLIACINFMNMATAKASSRFKEVGVRKVVGAQRGSLMLQFLGESVLISFISMIIAVGLVYTTLPIFNILVVKNISFNPGQPMLLLAMVGCVLVTGILAGIYPAFFLSARRPASALKGSASATGVSLRRALVVFQFFLTVVLVASAIIVFKQINFIRSKDIGYDRQSVLAFRTHGTIFSKFDGFRNEALKNPAVRMISRANESLVTVNNQNGSVGWPGKTNDNTQLFRTVVVDYDFLETMGLQLKAGRLFSRSFNDTSNFVITQRAAEVMGLDNPIGQKITQWGIRGTIVGVVSDFNARSLHEAIDPVIFMCNPSWAENVVVRFEGSETKSVVSYLQALYTKYSPDYPFEFSFLDDDFETLYANEKITSSLALGFTVMAIIISCLGLLGLASYTTERKKKEISIRKTLGASVAALVTDISKDFVLLSFVAVVMGCPVGWYLMNQFLKGYAYHVTPGWEVFAMTSAAVVLISLATVIGQVTKAALANPVDALRNE